MITKINLKARATEIYMEHIALASTNGRLFRKTVREQIIAEFGCSDASASTYYNNCKVAGPQIEGLGRETNPNMIRQVGKPQPKLQDDNDCYTTMELIKHTDCETVGRTCSHLLQGDASEQFDDITIYSPLHTWVMIKGLGPLSGATYKLGDGEVEIKRYTPASEIIEVRVTSDEFDDVDTAD